MSPTRRLVVFGGALGLSGCGFRPLYGPISGGAQVRPELAAVYVAVMTERSGQLLRQALQRRFEGSGEEGVAKLYELTGGLAVLGQSQGIQSDTSATRVRLIGSCAWTLRTLGLKPVELATGNARAVDGYNVNNQQYFAADLEQASADRRIAESVADQITLDVASFFRRRLVPA